MQLKLILNNELILEILIFLQEKIPHSSKQTHNDILNAQCFFRIDLIFKKANKISHFLIFSFIYQKFKF